MKNIFVIPTDQPSRVLKTIPKDNLILSKLTTSGSNWENQNIYITNNEVIKNGDYCINLAHKVIVKPTDTKWANSNSNNLKKLILTTDQDLIKDGIQAIDDEFLQWFVKNPSCEEVKIKSYYETLQDGLTFDRIEYKIIIPKEEPKQEWEVFFDEQGKLKLK